MTAKFRPKSESNAAVRDALATAAAECDRDLAEGGVTAAQVAQFSTLSASTIKTRLREIDAAVKVRGINRETGSVRVSWLPADDETLAPSHER